MECIYRFLMYTHNNYILTYIRRIINEYSEYIFAIFLTVYEAVKCRYIYILYYIILAVQLKHSMSINLNSYDKIVSKHVYCNILHSALPFITPWIGVIFHIRHTEVTIL